MSNTGFKGISRIDNNHPKHVKHGYQVYVGWQGLEDRIFVQDEMFDGDRMAALQFAIEQRDSMEKNWGKPRTEDHIRASGVSHDVAWDRT